MFTLLLLFVLGCSVEQTPKPDWAGQDNWKQWNECADSECRSNLIDSVFQVNDRIVAKWINLIEQTEEQYLQIERLQTRYPGRLKNTCIQLQNEALRSRCLTSAARPHLYARGNIRPPKSIPKRTASGPKASLIVLPLVPKSHLRAVEPYKNVCVDQVDQRSCLHRKAMEAVNNGDSLEVARYCEAIPSNLIRWRWECHFKAAEGFLSRDIQNYKIATDHCLVANEYSGRCVTVLNKILAKASPPADSNASAWKKSEAIAIQIMDVWKPIDEELSARILSSFWGFSLLHSYRTATKITGDPLDHLSAEVIPHIRAASAYEMLSRSPYTTNLSELLKKLEEHLSARKVSSKSVTEIYVPPTIQDLWMEDEPSDVDVVAINYLGRSRRTYSEDPEEDLSICILEAAARLSDGWLPLLDVEQNSTVESFRWTANRLLQRRR